MRDLISDVTIYYAWNSTICIRGNSSQKKL